MIGMTLGAYRIESELGAGGMGKVFRATVTEDSRDLSKGSIVSLKVIHPHLLEQPGFFKRFLREVTIGKAVRHENVVRTYDGDARKVDGEVYNFLVMEYVEGLTLRALERELSTVPEGLCRHIALEVCRGLSAIHGVGAVHRDLKPENVLITAEHGIKIMDLGVARLADEALRLSRTGAFLGSPLYASPEQFRGAGEAIDHRADLFALGILLYELSCGTHPHAGDSFLAVLAQVTERAPRKLGDRNPQLSAFFEELVHTLLAKDPADRFATAREVGDVLTEGEASAWWKEQTKLLRRKTRAPLRRIRLPRETAIYGRDAELERLRTSFDRAREGDGRVVLLQGETGIGKSRLAEELIGILQDKGEELNFLFGGYPPGAAATAAGAFSTAYREQLDGATLAEYLPRTPHLAGAFGALLRGEPPPADAAPLPKEAIQTCFIQATRALGAERPTVVMIDDLHFAPEEGRALFTALALAVPGHRVLLIGTLRPGATEEWVAGLTRFPQTSQVPLSRLGPKDLMLLLEDTFQSQSLARKLGHQVAVKSDGNPYFVLEILQRLREGLFITRRDDGTWITAKEIEEIEIPSSLLDLVHARVADLKEEEHQLLEVAACCGFEFDPVLVAKAAGIPVVPALRLLARIERSHRLVRTVGRDLVFDHHQVHEALHRKLLAPLRERCHGAIAAVMEEEAGSSEIQGAPAHRLCEHYLAAGDGPRALRHLDAAMRHLEVGFQNEAAAELAGRVRAVEDLVTGPERSRLLYRRAKCLAVVGRPEAERAALEEALALAEVAGDRALLLDVHMGLGAHFCSLRMLAEAEVHAERALALARDAGDLIAEAVILGEMGALHQELGRLGPALDRYRACLPLFTDAGDRSGLANAQASIAEVHQMLGNADLARKWLAEGMESAREIQREILCAFLTRVGALVEAQEGNFARAEELFRDGFERLRPFDSPRQTLDLELGYGVFLADQGRVEEAKEVFTRALATARECELPSESVLAAAQLAALGAIPADQAVAELRKSAGNLRIFQALSARFALWRATGDPAHLAESRRLLAFVREHAPREYRDSLVAHVPLHESIAAAPIP